MKKNQSFLIDFFGWGTVIRTQECRSQSLLYCFIYFDNYYYIITFKTVLIQAFSPLILSNLLFNTNYKITYFFMIWLDIG